MVNFQNKSIILLKYRPSHVTVLKASEKQIMYYGMHCSGLWLSSDCPALLPPLAPLSLPSLSLSSSSPCFLPSLPLSVLSFHNLYDSFCFSHATSLIDNQNSRHCDFWDLEHTSPCPQESFSTVHISNSRHVAFLYWKKIFFTQYILIMLLSPQLFPDPLHLPNHLITHTSFSVSSENKQPS